MADGVDTITDWSVVPGYGSEMMAPDDKVVFWVSGDSRIMTRGIWGIGHEADYAQESVPDDFQMGRHQLLERRGGGTGLAANRCWCPGQLPISNYETGGVRH
jgi:hypothetical protein